MVGKWWLCPIYGVGNLFKSSYIILKYLLFIDWVCFVLHSFFCCSSYLKKQLAADNGMYNRPLENPGLEISGEESFVFFVSQCLDGIKLM